jgi:phage tail sheath gpL-like
MPASVTLTGLSPTDPLPGNFLETLFAQGPSGGFSGVRSLMLIGNRTTAGNATVETTVYGPDTTVPAQSENDVINLTGTGSEIHRGWRRAQKVGKNSLRIYFICVAESAGAAATLTFTLANVPTGAGNIRVFVGDEFVDTAFAASDALATICANVVASVNGRSAWPVTAAAASPAVTLTARQKGLRGNWLRGMASINFGNGATPNTTITNTADTFFSGGTTADSNTNALGTIASTRYYYQASAAEDATQFGALVAQVNSMALPSVGMRQRCFCGSVDTQANTDTIAVTQNAARAELIWQKAGLWTPFELAAHCAALYAVEEGGAKPMCNFSGFPRNDSEKALWGPPAPRDQTAWPSIPTQRTALLNGVTPIAVGASGNTYMVKRITSRSLNGSNPDYRIRDAHKVTIVDFFGDELVQTENDELGGKNLTDDVPAGSPNQPPADTTTPARYRDLVNGVVNKYGNDFLLQKTDVTKAEMIVQRAPANAAQMQSSTPLYPVDILDSTASLVVQIS